jgi:superfamily II DNA/RNA helicase
LEQRSLNNNLKNVKPGDCLIAFSRRELYKLKRQVEQKTGGRMRCCMVYGSLPPEARREQARLFNEEGNGFDVLVASDAVGMGLNLNIGRVIFTAMQKFDGVQLRPLNVAEVKQIAGRAGRFKSIYPKGTVTCLHERDMPMLRKRMAMEVPTRKTAGVLPETAHLLDYASERLLQERVRSEVALDYARALVSSSAGEAAENMTKKERRKEKKVPFILSPSSAIAVAVTSLSVSHGLSDCSDSDD